jgi:hypothetical protein
LAELTGCNAGVITTAIKPYVKARYVTAKKGMFPGTKTPAWMLTLNENAELPPLVPTRSLMGDRSAEVLDVRGVPPEIKRLIRRIERLANMFPREISKLKDEVQALSSLVTPERDKILLDKLRSSGLKLRSY